MQLNGDRLIDRVGVGWAGWSDLYFFLFVCLQSRCVFANMKKEVLQSKIKLGK